MFGNIHVLGNNCVGKLFLEHYFVREIFHWNVFFWNNFSMENKFMESYSVRKICH